MKYFEFNKTKEHIKLVVWRFNFSYDRITKQFDFWTRVDT